MAPGVVCQRRVRLDQGHIGQLQTHFVLGKKAEVATTWSAEEFMPWVSDDTDLKGFVCSPCSAYLDNPRDVGTMVHFSLQLPLVLVKGG